MVLFFKIPTNGNGLNVQFWQQMQQANEFFHSSYVLVEISLIPYIGGCMLDPTITLYINKYLIPWNLKWIKNVMNSNTRKLKILKPE